MYVYPVRTTLLTVNEVELILLLIFKLTEHLPALVVQLAVLPLAQTPLTTAPDKAGLTVMVTVAFHEFLLITELLGTRVAIVISWLVPLVTVTDFVVVPVAPSSSVTVRPTV